MSWHKEDFSGVIIFSGVKWGRWMKREEMEWMTKGKGKKWDKTKFATAFHKIVRDVSKIVAFPRNRFCNAKDKIRPLRRKCDFLPSGKIFFSPCPLARPKGASPAEPFRSADKNPSKSYRSLRNPVLTRRFILRNTVPLEDAKFAFNDSRLTRARSRK